MADGDSKLWTAPTQASLPAKVALLRGDPAPDALLSFISSAKRRISFTQFTVDIRPGEDRFGEVRGLLGALGAAAARGVDVRAVLPRVEIGEAIKLDINQPAARFLCARGVRCGDTRIGRGPSSTQSYWWSTTISASSGARTGPPAVSA